MIGLRFLCSKKIILAKFMICINKKAYHSSGEMAEWSNAVDSKSIVRFLRT